MFELPSGKVDPSDHTVFSALTRELLEETGLHVTSVVGELDPFSYHTEKAIKGQNGTQIVSKDCIQLNYVVDTDGGEVVVGQSKGTFEVCLGVIDGCCTFSHHGGYGGCHQECFFLGGRKFEKVEMVICEAIASCYCCTVYVHVHLGSLLFISFYPRLVETRTDQA